VSAPNIIRAADALVRHQDARIDGFGVTLAMMSVEGQAAAIEDARVCIEAALGGSDESSAEDLAVEIHNLTDDGDAIPKAAFLRVVAAYVPDLRVCVSCDRAGGQHAAACDNDPKWVCRP